MLIAAGGTLQLKSRPPREKLILTIDQFFTALAEVHHSNAAGVVLSGMESDGTAGLKAIKDQGGITFAQLPASAAFPDMPQHAADAAAADFVLPPEQIPGKLIKLQESFHYFSPDEEDQQDNAIEEGFRQILTMLLVSAGADFSFYKQSTIRRRIVRRMVILKLENIPTYLQFIKSNRPELDLLFQDLLIPVSSFFRDPVAYGNLKENVFPEMLNNKSVNAPLRIWVAGCSTGQEPYSIAISLFEYLSESAAQLKIQIFASDISERAIKKARSGMYSKKELDGISEFRLNQFFNKLDGQYQVSKAIRDMCVFAVHNMLKDPPFAKMDLISCRNVLIYFQPFLQKKALTIFHYALNDKSILWLGKSETAGQRGELFISFKKSDKFYTRKSLPGKLKDMLLKNNEKIISNENHLARKKEGKTDDFQKIANDILLAKYTPAGVIVNDQFDIVQVRGSTGTFLAPLPGKASFNIFKMAKDGLAFELRNALHKARKSQNTIIKERIVLNAGHKQISIEVIPLVNAIEPHFMILFREDAAVSFSTAPAILTKSGKARRDENKSGIRQLERELEHAHEDMRSLTEEQESANEELQSSNEELLSGSEELQSLNEELETSREEIQSTNEELVTVNQELYESNAELDLNRKFAEATIAVLHEPLIVIDKNAKIGSANNAFYKTFQLTEEETLGKFLFQLQNNAWDIPELKAALNQIKDVGEKMIEVEITFELLGFGERVVIFNMQPLNRANGEKLTVLALNDVTLLREKNLKENVNAIVNAQQEERRRIAEVLHNELGQLLSMAKLKIPSVHNEAAGLVNQAITKVRTLSYELVPPVLEEFGLEAAVKDMIAPQLNDANIEFTLVITGLKKRIDPVMEITAYRIVQELLNNVVKHAKSTRLELKIACIANNISISLIDNGIGFPEREDKQDKKGFGLMYISGRVHLLHGKINITSEKQQGTKVLIDLPLEKR
jgi:two-component system CheB/CheR fusion protein